MIYFDHASTSFPKPKKMLEEIGYYLDHIGVSPGRGSYTAQKKALDYVNNVRYELASLFNISETSHLVFTNNATHSLNIALKGSLKAKDHVLVCSFSHNSAIRPLEFLKREKNIEYDFFQVNGEGEASLEEIQNLVRPNTSFVIFNHASNVIGVKFKFEKLIPFFQKNNIKILLDTAQTAGAIPIDVDLLEIDFLVGTGHKTLLGPSGIGFLYIKNPEIVQPLVVGGSGGTSSSSFIHPEIMPEKFEAGTINYLGVAGIFGSLKDSFYEKKFQESIHLTYDAWQKLSELQEVELYGTSDFEKKIPIISFSIKDIVPKTIEELLDKDYQIAVRAGLQCAPVCHRTLNTYPQGTLRISFGHTNSVNEIDFFIEAIKKIISKGR